MRARGWLVVLVLFGSAGCGPGADVVAQRDELRKKVEDLTKKNERLEAEVSHLNAKVVQLQDQVARYRKREVFLRLGIEEGGSLEAKLDTSKGTIHCELWPDVAPQTVLNFVELAEGKKKWTDPRTGRKTARPLYDGTIFHRVIPKFMIQGGDPLGNGTGGPGYRFKDEIDPKVTFDTPGLLAMANAGPNTNGSQFFITDRSTPHYLDGKHTIFGKCADPDVVKAIAEVPRGARDKPLTDVVLEHVEIVRPHKE